MARYFPSTRNNNCIDMSHTNNWLHDLNLDYEHELKIKLCLKMTVDIITLINYFANYNKVCSVLKKNKKLFYFFVCVTFLI